MIKAPAAGTKGFIVELNGDWGLLPGNPHEGDGDDNGDELEKESYSLLANDNDWRVHNHRHAW